MKTRQQMINLVDRTVKDYGSGKFKISRDDNESCLYQGKEENQKCAVGCRIKKSALEKIHREDLNSSNFQRLLGKIPDRELFLKSYQGFDPRLWLKLQTIHDISAYWEGSQLSEDGLAEVESLKEDIKHGGFS